MTVSKLVSLSKSSIVKKYNLNFISIPTGNVINTTIFFSSNNLNIRSLSNPIILIEGIITGEKPAKVEWLLNGSNISSHDSHFEFGQEIENATTNVSCAHGKYKVTLQIKREVEGNFQYQVYNSEGHVGQISTVLVVTGKWIDLCNKVLK